MMISPEAYAEELKADSLQNLIKERDELLDYIQNFEKNCIDFQKRELIFSGDGWNIHPSPDVMYQAYLEYLAKVSVAISNKFNQEFESDAVPA